VIWVIRRIVGVGLAALAIRWLVLLAIARTPARLAERAYPNEWGVRTAPLSAAEAVAAWALERELAASMPPEVVPGVRIVRIVECGA
jgi:hypothetical protein